MELTIREEEDKEKERKKNRDRNRDRIAFVKKTFFLMIIIPKVLYETVLDRIIKTAIIAWG